MATIIPVKPVPTASRGADNANAPLRAAALGPAGAEPVTDTLGRALSDLRISVTDRCNFRCIYCMPKDVFDNDYQYLPHADLLTFEEITRVAKVFVAMACARSG